MLEIIVILIVFGFAGCLLLADMVIQTMKEFDEALDSDDPDW